MPKKNTINPNKQQLSKHNINNSGPHNSYAHGNNFIQHHQSNFDNKINLNLKVKILNNQLGTMWPLPAYATPGSAGLDLRACIEKSLILSPGEVKLIPTGLAIYIDNPGYAGIILPRSGLGHKHGIILGNSVGLIDSDYQGELFISCWNRSQQEFMIEVGERIAQLVLVKIAQVNLEITDNFQITSRAAGGFGHTGTS